MKFSIVEPNDSFLISLSCGFSKYIIKVQKYMFFLILRSICCKNYLFLTFAYDNWEEYKLKF